MANPLFAILKTGVITLRNICPDLPEEALGLPTVTQATCSGCCACVAACAVQAVRVNADAEGNAITLDTGVCLACNGCVEVCPTGTIAPNRSTRVATRQRDELVLSNRIQRVVAAPEVVAPFLRSLHVREVSTGCNAADLEVIASTNAVFDVARFGIHFVASPRFADALLVTGPVGRAMREPLLRCYEAMAEPRIVIAVGASAISGGVHRAGYTEANGIADILPVSAYVPGEPPHPWSIIHGLLLAMGRN